MDPTSTSKDVLFRVGYPVEDKAATAAGLKKLYGLPPQHSAKDEKWSELLNHCFAVFVKEAPCYCPRSDHLGTLSMLLCGRERAGRECKYQGRTMTMLDRAILQESKEYAAALDRFLEDSDEELAEIYGPYR